jgi:hypothetical protein
MYNVVCNNRATNGRRIQVLCGYIQPEKPVKLKRDREELVMVSYKKDPTRVANKNSTVENGRYQPSNVW